MKNKINILSVLPVLGQPRDSKRISMLKNIGFNVRAAYFEREYLKGRAPVCNVISLGEISHKKYIRRIFKFINALPLLRNEIKKCDLVYASSPDMAYMSIIAGLGLRKPVIVEVGDIRNIQVKKGAIGYFIRKIDFLFLKGCSLLISTSYAFVKEYYRKWLKSDIKYLILENKLESNCLDNKLDIRMKDNKIIIGYFGLLRCSWSWNVLKEIAKRNSNKFKIVIAGYPINPYNLPDEAKDIPNIEFLGEYKSPEDLASLYNKVDIVWACYPFPKKDEFNWKWARTNRFYESIYYKRPMIVLEESGDANNVLENEIGFVLPRKEVSKVVSKLSEITQKQIEFWTINVSNLPKSMYVYTTEEEELKKEILKIL